MGKFKIYGKAARGYFEANVGIILSASIDPNGQPMVDITSADFGPIPVPEDMTSAISAMVQEAYTGALGPLATGFQARFHRHRRWPDDADRQYAIG